MITQHKSRLGVLFGIVFVCSLFFSSAADAAATFDLAGVGDAQKTATVSMEYDDANAVLIVNVTNTSSSPLTGIFVNVPEQVLDVVKFVGPQNWTYLLNKDNIGSANTAGKFDIYAVTGYGGMPSAGLTQGQTGQFAFVFNEIASGTLDNESFILATSVTTQSGEQSTYFAAKFDDVVAVPSGNVSYADDVQISTPALGDIPAARAAAALKSSQKAAAAPQNMTAVPEPSTVVLMGVGLVGVLGLGRKKLKKS